MRLPSAFRSDRDNVAAAALLIVAAGTGAFIWFGLPHDREVSSLAVLLFKLVPFVCAAAGIAVADPNRLPRPLKGVLICLGFLVLWCYFVPKLFFSSDDSNELYYVVLTATPFLILTLTMAYRLGGATTEHTLRLAFALLLLMLSGLEDLAFLTVNHQTDPRWTPIPEVWSWASHMTVILGHPATKYEAYAFIAVHVALAALVLLLPVRALTRRRFAARAAAEG
jgi:hypothetical protein